MLQSFWTVACDYQTRLCYSLEYRNVDRTYSKIPRTSNHVLHNLHSKKRTNLAERASDPQELLCTMIQFNQPGARHETCSHIIDVTLHQNIVTTDTKQTSFWLQALTKLYRYDGNNDNHCNRGLNSDNDGQPGGTQTQEGFTLGTNRFTGRLIRAHRNVGWWSALLIVIGRFRGQIFTRKWSELKILGILPWNHWWTRHAM